MAFFQDNLGKPAPERLTILDFTGARDDGWQWHQLDHMQIICTLLQTDNHTSTSPLTITSPKHNLKLYILTLILTKPKQ